MTATSVFSSVSDLLRNPAARATCFDLARKGKAYSAFAEQFARRPIVRQAVALLAARLERMHARMASIKARAGEAGRIARLAGARRLDRTRRAVLAAANYRVARNGHDTIVKIGSPSARSETGQDRSVYRGAFKGWAATTSQHTFTVPADWLETVKARGLASCDGMLTLSAEPIPGHDVELYQATWVEQGRGTSLNTVRGYIARIGKDTYHAGAVAAALTGVRRKAKQLPPRRVVDLDRLVRRHGDVAVTIEDARACGLCSSGTASWCHAVGIDPTRHTTLANVVAGYKLRPLPDALRVIRYVVRQHRQWQRVLSTPPEGRVRFDAEGGFRVE